ncbi:alpha-1,6-mannosylglycoprotein 6-beta-N-acetylglucosaminyltransferase A-like [Plectropomus leopardus]|uniref:alpha-1,6-mannosylglycoprotein 6-beta-N-acetylglucosaminyltransferase A-like n=1 Tax=Plectropomus leopardus TaxID=160734 RepID=UPI001C4AB790|nr:alpha-1,6-mannosylglycoprotein 6-beta-N-acetylglucosaminyltransferase A-like [Plectropomus leopardus]
MRKPKGPLSRTVCLLMVIGFIWCLSLPYFILSSADQRGISATKLRQHGKVWMETGRAEEIMTRIVKFVDDLLNIVGYSNNFSRPPPLRDYQEELQLLQIKMEAEKEKGQLRDEMIKELRSEKIQLQQQVAHGEELLKLQAEKEEKKLKSASPPPPLRDYKEELQSLRIKMEAEKEKGEMRDEMIKELRSDKLHLQQQVAHLEELLKLQAEKKEMTLQQVKTDDKIEEDKNCPLPPLDGYPDCMGKLKWMKGSWKSDPCYSLHGVNGSLCSNLIYLSEIESWCPVLPGRVIPVEEKAGSDHAVVQESLKDLYPLLDKRVQFRWIRQRIGSMEKIWVEAGRSLSAKYNLTERKAKQILVHPGAVTDESHVRIAEAAFSGGPLGELVQWSDLISTLYILGHHVHLTASIPDLKYFLGVKTGGCPPRQSKVEVDLIYTDIIGLRQIQAILNASWIKYRCKIRVLDTFGTEPDFNHIGWAKKHNLSSPFGSLHLIPMQFYTMFPHTPDNTFLGFVVQHQLSSEQAELLKSTSRQNQALVYGKRGTFWKGKEAYVDIIHKYLEVHGTVDSSATIPKYVKNHGIVKGTEVQTLLRQSKVFVGLSFPYEGPAPLEAIANGCAFLNPRLYPPQSSLNTDFFKGKPNIREVTSQHPYAEAIGEPYVWMVDMHNSTDVERALTSILNQTLEPYLPYEFSCEGMLQRVNSLIEKQDLCSSTASWPPLSALQVVEAKVNMSCKQECQRAGLICEPAFFPHVNNAENLAKYSVDCQTSELSDSHLVFPAYNSSSKHCLFQSDSLLFSCVRSDPALIRVCPCRDYIKDQIALCKACV